MIDRIGVIYQDTTSLGLLIGIQRRLGCSAEIFEPTVSVGRSTNMNRRQATLAWQQFFGRGAQLIVRLTDADGNRWQDVKRNELRVFPQQSQSVLVCGVCDRNVESWLTASLPAFAEWIGKPIAEVQAIQSNTGVVKNLISNALPFGKTKQDFVSDFVAGLLPQQFRQLMDQPSFSDFYQACKAAAMLGQCPMNNNA